MKINKLEIENTKRVKAVIIEPTEDGLTIIGGNNNQGKTSVLDSIAWALGGNKFKPSTPQREGSSVPPEIRITMSNGLVVERKGKISALKVIDPSGRTAGQALLDTFVEELALDLPKFMNQNNKDKARTLLQIIGVGDKLFELEQEEKEKSSERTQIGRIHKQKQSFADEQTYFTDAPSDLINASDLIKEQQAILNENAVIERKRELLAQVNEEKLELQNRLKELQLSEDNLNKELKDKEIKDISKLEEEIMNVEDTNSKVRANLEKDRADDDAADFKKQYDNLTEAIETLRNDKLLLLKGAKLPLDELSVDNGELTYKGFEWDNMSGSEQLKVSTAIVRELNPECKFVLIDKLEQFDSVQLKEFGDWIKTEGLQAIATRVSTGEECSLIIEDGYVSGQEDIMFNKEELAQEKVEEKWQWK